MDDVLVRITTTTICGSDLHIYNGEIPKIGRMGNSLGISLPKSLAQRLDVTQGDEIEFIENDQGEILLKKVRQSVFGDDAYATIFDKAAALVDSLANNHSFHNGNKRTAYAAVKSD